MAELRSFRSVAGPAPIVAEPSRRHRPDYWLLILSIALLGIGLIVVYAISPALGAAQNVNGSHFVSRQAIAIAVGAVGFIVASRLPLAVWRKFCLPLIILAGLTTLVALVMPVDPHYPAHRWIRLGSFSFQSVELLKFAFLVWLAGFLGGQSSEGQAPDMKKAFMPLMAALLVVGIIVAGIQSDLGSMVVIVAMFGIMAFVAGLPLRRLFLVGLAIAILGVGLISTTAYRRERLATFFHPTADCQSTGYQACQALISVGSGGTFGLGLGRSVQAYGYLPEAANDSIFAIYAEKFGFIGVVALLALEAAFFSRLASLAARASNSFNRLFTIGVLTWLAVQAMINIGAMLGLLPLKGITLPLVSYGGTSLVFVMAALGIVFNMSHYTNYATAKETASRGQNTSGAQRAVNRRNLERQRAGNV
jgi:cell division protein FtsW